MTEPLSTLHYSVWRGTYRLYNRAGKPTDQRVMLWACRYYTKEQWTNRDNLELSDLPNDQDLAKIGLRARRLPDDQITSDD